MTRVLFDENMPHQLRRDLREFDVRTVQEEQWTGLENGALLHAAEEAGYDVLLTFDRRMQHQQNISARRIAVVVVRTLDVRLLTVRPLVRAIRDAIVTGRPGEVTIVAAPK